MQKDHIYIKICANINMQNIKFVLKNKYNKVVFETFVKDCFDKIKIPICNHEVYKLIIISKVNKCVVPLIAKKNETYFINIAGNNLNDRKQLITIRLMDANYPNIRIKGGKMIIWQDIQSQ